MKQRKAARSRRAEAAPAEVSAPAQVTPAEKKSFPIVGIGASAGGLEALTELLKGLPVDTGMGFVLVQHLDPKHDSELTHILTRMTAMRVQEVVGNTRVEPNHVYVIPPNAGMSISQGVLQLHPRAVTGSFHSINSFFQSLAEDQRECAIGIVLSGTASDGTVGVGAIKEQNGITFAQDDTAKYDSMPRSAIAAGYVDFVLSPGQMAAELARIAKHPYVSGAGAGAGRRSPKEAEGPEALTGAGEGTSERRGAAAGEEHGFGEILGLLRHHAAVDFSSYKSSTIQRRITRRIVLKKLESMREYARLLAGNGKELDALYADLLINVTAFFRNPEAFDALKRLVFPKLLGARRVEPLRVWVPGCSSGQEAYSLAMALTEYGGGAAVAPKLQIFATDLSEPMLEKARGGLYPKALVQELSPERLRRFFVEEEGGFRVIKSLRDGMVFARQNLLSDPPFSRLDLISCRNLLIYLEPALQQKIIPMFHYALKPEGHLFLGASESISSFTELFEATDRKHKIYARKAGSTSGLHLGMGPRHPGAGKSMPPAAAQPETVAAQPSAPNAQREADRIALNRYAPPGVLLNAEWQVLQFRGETSPFLKPPSGKPNFSVLNMASDELKQPLRAALQKAKRDRRVQRRENLRVDQNGHSRTISLEVVPLVNLKEACFLVFFEEPLERPRPQRPELVPGRETSGPAQPAPETAGGKARTAASGQRAAELERELAEARDYLQSVQEQYEAANEELQATNEELETSKEELESGNEELLTVNEEMAHRNAELGRLTSDLLNFQGAANMAIVLLALDQTVRRFTTKATGAFNLTASDVGRSIHSIRFNLELPDLEQMVAEVINTLQEREREVRDRSGRWHSLRVLPYRSVDNTIDGTVLVLVDVDALKRNAQELIEARDYTEAIVRSTRDMLVVLNADLRVNSTNEVFYETFHISPGEAEGRLIYELGNGQWNIPRLRELLEEILPRNNFFTGFEVSHEFKSIGRRVMVLNARTLSGPEGRTQRILLGIHDITQTVDAQEQVRRSELRYRRLFEAAQDGVLLLDPATQRILDANPFMTELLGRTREELRDRTPNELGLFETPDACQKLFGQLRGESFRHKEDLPLLTRAGERREVEFISNLYEEDGTGVIQCNVRDITERKRAEAALASSEKEFRLLAEAMPQIVWITRADGANTYFNQQWVDYTGLTLEESYGDGWNKPFHADDRQRAWDAWQNAVRNGATYSLECRLRRADGAYRWWLIRGAPVRNERGEITKWFGTCTDIHDLKKGEEALRRSEAQLAQAVRVGQVGTFEHDHRSDVITFSPVLREMIGLAEGEEITIAKFLSRVLPEDREGLAAAIRRAHDPAGDGMFQAEYRVPGREGQTRWLSVRSETFFEGEGSGRRPVRTIGAVLDVTERKDVQAGLERLVAERTAKLQELVGELEHFSYTITHDMRAPLRGMQGFAELMAQACAGGQVQDAQRFLERIRTSAGRMDALITDALNYSKAVRQELALSPVDPGALLRGMLDSYPELQPSQARIEIKGEIPAVMGNEAALTQCFSNLLGNAVKFVKPGEKPEIVIWAERRDEAATGGHRGARPGPSHLTPAPVLLGRGECGWVRIWVEDKGIGISEPMQARVFDMFSRGQNTYAGTGIGLALVRKVVERMGGSVGVESEEGRGSRFWVELQGVRRAGRAGMTRRAEEAGEGGKV